MALTKISTAMISQSAAAVDLNVDAGTFYVDTTNNRVGVGGKTDPDTPLHVVGTATATLFAGSGASLTSIPNAALVNSSITINSTAVSLGGSLTLTTANIAENTNLYYTDARADARIAAADTDDLSEGSSNLYYTDARVDARVSGGSLGNITTTGYIRGPASVYDLDPAAHGDDTGTVVIAGNLQVDGTTTTINSTTMTVDDKNITLASGSANAAAASGAGFTVDIGTGTNPAITYDGTNDEWDFNKPLNVTGTAAADAFTFDNYTLDSNKISTNQASGYNGDIFLDAAGDIILDAAGNDVILKDNGTTFGQLTNDSGNLVIYNSGSQMLKGLSTGPNAEFIGTVKIPKLGINASANSNYSLYALQNGSITHAAYLQVNGGTATGLEINASASSAYSGDVLYARQSSRNTGGNLARFANSDGDKFVVKTDGNVGIGTSSPASNLHIKIATAGTAASTVAAGTSAGIYLEDDQTPTDNYFVSKVHNPGNDTAIGGIKFAVSPDGGNYSWAGIKGLTSSSGNAGNLAFYTSAGNTSGDSSTERMRIDSSGDVGIGVVPATHARLTIGGTATSYSSSLVFDNNTAGGAEFFMLASDNTWSAGANKFLMGHGSPSSSAVDIAIDADGKVGIGTYSPGAPLHVNSDTEHQIKIQSTASAGASMQLYSGGSYSYTVYQHPNANFRIGAYGGTSFIIRDQGNAADRLTIINNGNVGIGTDAPGQKLVVQGSNHIATLLNTSTANNAYSQLMLQAGSSTNYIWTQNQNSTLYGGAHSLNIYTQQAGPIAFFTGGNNERMRIDGTGHIGIGVIPESGWSTTATVLQFGESGALWGDKSGEDWSYFSSNTYWDGTNFKYKNTNEASYYVQDNQGEHVWAVAPSGSADANITFNQAMKLDQSGKLLLGTTNVAPGSGDVAGSVISPDGYISVSRTSVSAEFNRIGSNGDIIVFRKGGDLVGSWQARGDVVSTIILDPRTNGAGLTAAGASLFPTNNAGAVSDGAIDLGYSVSGTNVRFKDLYLSGGAQLGAGNNISWGGAYGAGIPTISAGSDFFAFYPNGSTSGQTMRIDASGNVGIGTNSPSDASWGAVGLNKALAIDGTTGYANIHLRGTGAGTSDTRYSMGVGDGKFYMAYDDITNTHRITIDATGEVGIGTTGPTSKLHVVGAPDGTNATTHILQNAATNGPTLFIEQTGEGGNTNVNQGLLIKVDGNNGGYGNIIRAIGTNSNINSGTEVEAFIVKNDGKVGIGETSPQGKLHIKEGDAGSITANTNFDQLILEDDQHSGMQIWSGSGYDGAIYFGDPSGPSQGQLKYRHSTESFEITANNGTPSLNIFNTVVASEVDVSIKNGKNLELQTTSGLARGFISAQETNTGGTHTAGLIIATSSGESITFKDNGIGGTTNMVISGAGDVSISDGNLSVANGHGIDFSATPNSGTTGTTHTSSLLDDYEEGYWTPIFIGSSGTFSQAQQLGSYTKIGNLIHLTWYAGVNGLGTATGSIQIGNLPYAASGGGTTNNRITTGSCMVDNLTLSAGKTWVHPYMSHGATTIQFYQSGTSTSWATTPVDAVFTMIGGISYRTA